MAKTSYHHGNLKQALLEVARDLLEVEGLPGLSLRKCSERVGVSNAAPKNHFGNLAGLLTALATEGYAELADAMTEELAEDADRSARRAQALHGYVAFAQANPALYELMFARGRVSSDDPHLLAGARACFLILADVSRDLGWFPDLDDPDAADGRAQVALWSFVHGYAQLTTANRLKKNNMQGLSILDLLPRS